MKKWLSEQLAEVLPARLLGALPSRARLLGDILVLPHASMDPQWLLEENFPHAQLLARSLMRYPQYAHSVRLVLIQSKIAGELRQPEFVRILATKADDSSRSLETCHREAGIHFWLDCSLVMFSAGNGTERMRMARQRLPRDCLVVDMFAGIGYFSIPMAKKSKAAHVVSIEKNPMSARFLKMNAEANKCQNVVTIFCGDNREMASEYLGRADRVLMGYIPTPVQFLSRALAFLKKQGGIIYYHYTSSKEEREAIPREHLSSALLQDARFTIKSIVVTKVKNYAPQLLHYVADVELVSIPL